MEFLPTLEERRRRPLELAAAVVAAVVQAKGASDENKRIMHTVINLLGKDFELHSAPVPVPVREVLRELAQLLGCFRWRAVLMALEYEESTSQLLDAPEFPIDAIETRLFSE